MAGKGGNKTPLPSSSTITPQSAGVILSKQFVYQMAPGGAEFVATAQNVQRIAQANEGYEAHPESLKQWRAEVLELSSDGRSALVRCKGDTTIIWVPLEVPNVIVGDRVVVDFRDEGGVAVVLIVQ